MPTTISSSVYKSYNTSYKSINFHIDLKLNALIWIEEKMKPFQVILLCTIIAWLANAEPIRERRHAGIDADVDPLLVVHDEPKNLNERHDHHHHHHRGHHHHHHHHDDHRHHHNKSDHKHDHQHHDHDEGFELHDHQHHEHDYHQHHEGDHHHHHHFDDHHHNESDHHHDHQHHDHDEGHDQHDHQEYDHHHQHHDDHHHYVHLEDDHPHHQDRPGDDHHHDLHHEHGPFKFQVGNDFGAYEYLDNDGSLKGFYVDIMEQVCAEAHHKCYAVYDDPQRCWYTSGDNKEQKPGIGLMSGWYDGCIGYTQSPDRASSFEFSEAFTENFLAGIYVRKESTRTCNPMDLAQLKIGFIHGWSMNQLCLTRHFSIKGNMQGDYTEHMFQRYEDMVTAMVKSEIDAMFTIAEYVPVHLRLRPLCDVTFTCSKAGISMMTNKGSPVAAWWNKAFNAILENGIYQETCQNATRDHGNHGAIHCLRED